MGSPSKSLIAALELYRRVSPKNEIIAGPAVFEFESSYAVVWATSQKGSGCIKIRKNGQEKTIWDSKGGVIKTHDTVHIVRTEKADLQNSCYKVFSQGVKFKFGYSALKGKCTESDYIEFSGNEKEDDISILVLSDIHNMAQKAQEAAALVCDKPDFTILLGDIASETEHKKAYVDGILKIAGKITQGKSPVIYTRGNHETRGEFASQMVEYFPSDSGEFFFTLKKGAVSAIILDSGEDKEDGHIEYSGLVDFASYREKEYAWLCSLKDKDFDGKYKLVFSHDPFIADHFGKDWTLPLKKLGADIIIGGHIHHPYFESGRPAVLSVCGKNKNTGHYGATVIKLKDGRITAKTVSDSGETLLEEQI